VKGKISEIFESIQGEGIYLGERQLFVRFFGCNLKCRYCDTRMDSFIEYEPEDLVNELKKYGDGFHSVSFTGGEPLLQKDFLKEVLGLTRKCGFRIYLETNGTLPESLSEIIDYLDFVAMDLKLPSSTGLSDFWDTHHKFLQIASQKEVFLKAVICRDTKEEDLRATLRFIQDNNKSVVLVLQPNSYENDALLKEKIEGFRNICLDEKVSACIIPQVQKIINIK
jgi:organic radical activating enzyme